jgi:hypothetical protein
VIVSREVVCMRFSARKRREKFQFRLRYSLRTLMLATALFAFVFAIIGEKVRQAYVQRQCVLLIRSMGGEVYYECDVPGHRERNHIPVWLAGFVGKDMLFDVVGIWIIYNHSVRDNDLERFAALSHVEGLYLQGSNISDEGLLHLYKWKSLKVLFVKETIVTDEGCAKLQNALPKLDVIH